MRMVVVLPEPFGPRKPWMRARGIARSMPSTATTSPKRRVSPWASIASVSLMEEVHLHRHAGRQVLRAIAFEIDFGEEHEAPAVALGQRVIA
jgi:hypothetical protein